MAAYRPLAAGIGAVCGAIVGSFIATLVIRWGAGDSVVAGRSRCDGCGTSLSPLELIPLISWLLQRGRCRTCNRLIARLHWAVELAAAVIGGAMLWVTPDARGLALALFGWQLLTLGLLDARYWWLPHRLTALLALTGVMLGGIAMSGAGLAVPLQDRLIGAAGGFGALFVIAVLYRAMRNRDGLGGGDAPMLGAIGGWVGWQPLPLVMLLAAVAGIALAVGRHGDGNDWAMRKLPLGTLMAIATPFAVVIMVVRSVS